MSRPPLAIVGLSALFPGSQDKTGFWRDILAGRDLITDVPETHWLISDYYDPDPQAPDKTYAKRGAFLSPADFDPLEHGIPPNVVPATDSSQLLALIAAKQVLEDAVGGKFSEVDRDRTSVILGVTGQGSGRDGRALQHSPSGWALRGGAAWTRSSASAIGSPRVTPGRRAFPGLLGNVIAGRTRTG
jgi:acyl transferase domain-containing protein